VADSVAALLSYGHRQLASTSGRGAPARLLIAGDEGEEAAVVVREIQRLIASGEVREPGECAVLYRTHAQSAPVEVAMLAAGVPYRLAGDTSLLASFEVRAALAYLRLVANPDDSLALARALNTPSRGLAALARRLRAGLHLSVHDLESRCAAVAPDPEAEGGLRRFLDLYRELASLAGTLSPVELLAAVVERSGLARWLASRRDNGSACRRLDALRALAAASDARDLPALIAELEVAEPEGDAARGSGVALSTIHAAKGLEFTAVFVVGLAEGTLPHARAIAQAQKRPDALDEEVRLLYVAVTRAKRRLYLSYPRSRELGGRSLPQAGSRFLAALPTGLVRAASAD
jgi:DNA helicase-2/ATP-dependent DNA helicase PcrA